MTLRFFLPSLFVVFITITTIFSFLTIRSHVLMEVKADQYSRAMSSLNSLQGNVERFLFLGDIEGVKKAIASLGAQPDLNVIFVTDKRGKVIASTHQRAIGQQWDKLHYLFDAGLIYEVPRTKVTQVLYSEENNLITGYTSVCNAEASNSLRPQRCGFLYYSVDALYLQDKAMTSLLNLIGLSLLGFLLSAFLFSVSVYYRVTRRVMRLVDVLQRFSKGEHSVRAHVEGADELAQIGQSIDSLFEQMTEERGELIASEQMQKAIINSSSYSIISTTPEGMIRSFNKAAEKMLGYQAQDLIDKQSPALFHLPEEVVEQAKTLSMELETQIEPGFEVFIATAKLGQLYEREWTYVHKNGERIPVMLSVTAVYNHQGDITAYLGVAKDLTEQKRVDKIKSEFISTVSHELRTPLTSIKGSLGLVKSGMLGELPEKLVSMLEIAFNNSERLIRLINDILDIEKIAAGKMDFKMSEFSLDRLLEQSVVANKGYGEEKGATFKITKTIENAQVEADHDRLMQVMANLLSNAAKFSHEGGEVEIKLTEHDEHYRVSVIDFGIGIPIKVQPTVFDRFIQGDSSDTRQQGGTGLGLSITKSIVESHHGHIDFISTPEGTTFYFEIPKMQQPIARALPQLVLDKSGISVSLDVSNVSAQTGENNESECFRILICEDDKDITTLLSLMLQQNGYETDIAFDTTEAKELLTTKRYDAMTLDLGLPGQDGISFIHELRLTEDFKRLPIVVVSANAKQGKDSIEAEGVGVIDWLQKPIDQDQLANSLQLAFKHSPDTKPHILHVEDDEDIKAVTRLVLEDLATVTSATTLAEAKQYLAKMDFDLVILDLALPDGNGEKLLPMLKTGGNTSIPVVVFSARQPSQDNTTNIRAELIKSQTSNENLLETIRNAIQNKVK